MEPFKESNTFQIFSTIPNIISVCIKSISLWQYCAYYFFIIKKKYISATILSSQVTDPEHTRKPEWFRKCCRYNPVIIQHEAVANGLTITFLDHFFYSFLEGKKNTFFLFFFQYLCMVNLRTKDCIVSCWNYWNAIFDL